MGMSLGLEMIMHRVDGCLTTGRRGLLSHLGSPEPEGSEECQLTTGTEDCRFSKVASTVASHWDRFGQLSCLCGGGCQIVAVERARLSSPFGPAADW